MGRLAAEHPPALQRLTASCVGKVLLKSQLVTVAVMVNACGGVMHWLQGFCRFGGWSLPHPLTASCTMIVLQYGVWLMASCGAETSVSENEFHAVLQRSMLLRSLPPRSNVSLDMAAAFRCPVQEQVRM